MNNQRAVASVGSLCREMLEVMEDRVRGPKSCSVVKLKLKYTPLGCSCRNPFVRMVEEGRGGKRWRKEGGRAGSGGRSGGQELGEGAGVAGRWDQEVEETGMAREWWKLALLPRA